MNRNHFLPFPTEDKKKEEEHPLSPGAMATPVLYSSSSVLACHGYRTLFGRFTAPLGG